MEKNKKWCIWTLVVTFIILIIIASAVVIVDPFFHYHKPIEKISYRFGDKSYINPGIVQHFEYDSLITGTSMTENFKTSYFNEVLGLNAIKVPYSGGRSKNMNIILEMALKNNPNLRTVFLGLDLYMLKSDVDETRHPLPYYLYDTNPLNDISYLLNKDVLFERLAYNILETLKGNTSTTFDDYSYWQNSYTFSQYTVIGSNMDMKKAEAPDFSLDEAIRIADDNLQENILPLIEAYPDTKFVIFYPPYSILYWYQNYAEHELGILEHSVRTLTPYENVELFLFQNDSAIVTNLYNYKDYTHYSADINTYMVDCFKNGTHRLTMENYETELEKMKNLAYNFDFGLLFGESNPFVRENNFLKYFDNLNDSRYIMFINTRMDMAITAYDMFGDQYARFGLDSDKSGCGHVAIVNGGKAVFQESHDDAILFNGIVDGLTVNLISEKRGDENYVEVLIDGVKYTTNQAGVNIVVYDTEFQRVMDNITVNPENMSISRK